MSVLDITLLLFGVFVFSVFFTHLVRIYSLRNSLIDIPNERSSHKHPTPRGGGFSIVISVLSSLILLYYMDVINLNLFLALSGGGFIVAFMGWLDDHRHRSPLVRIVVYTIATSVTLYLLGGMVTVKLGIYIIQLSIISQVLVVLAWVWLINLYNFMDGADALAAVQIICAGLFLCFLFLINGQYELTVLTIILVTASCGFLYWNWPPAKIFMGDVGSCFVGFYFGALVIMGENSGSVPVLVSLILISVFICDATYTLVMRILRKERWYSAHRSHAYQILVQSGMSHKKLVMLLLVVNVFLLWPVSYISYNWHQFSIFILLFMMALFFVFWALIQFRFRHFSISGK